MTFHRALLALALAVLSPALAPTVARADDAEEEEEFDTTWLGLRLEYWYRPAIDMEMQIGGQAFNQLAPLGLTGTPIDIHDDLGVEETPSSDYMFDNGIFAAEAFFDTRWVSLRVGLTPPFQYDGETIITRTINFGGQTFTASTPVESKFRQFLGHVEVGINIINNDYVRLAPVVSLRAIGVDWELEAPQLGLKGDTSDIDTPLKWEDMAVIPYPELGAEARLGLRKWIEADLKVSGSLVNYFGVEGHSLTVDAGVTGYPIPWVGLRLGMRYNEIAFESQTDDADEQFDYDLKFLGATLSLIVRFG